MPRYLRRPVPGRIGADGQELAPLDTNDVEAAAKFFAAEDVESVAVCLFNSFLDGAHERSFVREAPGERQQAEFRIASARGRHPRLDVGGEFTGSGENHIAVAEWQSAGRNVHAV